MTNPLTLLFTLCIIAAAHSANHCEGDYNKDLQKVLEKIAADRSYWTFGSKAVKNIRLNDAPFKDICNDATKEEKLSICMKVLQHTYRVIRPTSFTVDPTEWDHECKPRWFRSKGEIYHQRMYACPTTTVKFSNDRKSMTEDPFLIGQGLHEVKYRVHFFDGSLPEGPAFIQGQLTGFKLNAYAFEIAENGHHTYKPWYDQRLTACEVTIFRDCGHIDDYILELDDEPQQ